MKLSDHRLLDALCGEYLVGTLRGGARRRFERALHDEPLVALRLRHWLHRTALRPSARSAIAPSRAAWSRLERELGLARYRVPWRERFAARVNWPLATAASMLAALALLVRLMLPIAPEFEAVALLAGPQLAATVTAAVSHDRTRMRLHATRAVPPGAGRSYELWVIPREGGAPIGLVVLDGLDAQFDLPGALSERLRGGAKLAISIEPEGGSPTDAPTGPVVLVGIVSA